MKPEPVDTVLDDDRWALFRLNEVARTAATATLAHLGLDPARFEISLLGCSNARIAALNAEFRGKPVPTNVLSWPSATRVTDQPGTRPALPKAPRSGPPEELGDIAIAYETCLAEASEAGKAPQDHVTHLIVHGILHLLGYDHISDTDAALMEATEMEILGKLGIADPYRG